MSQPVDEDPDEPEVSAPIFHDWRQTCRRRTLYLLAALGLWTLVVGWRLLDVMVVDRQSHLESFRAQAIRSGIVAAARGRILDRQGRALAWSERYFQLVYEPPADGGGMAADLAAMRVILPIDERALMDQAYRRPGRDLLVVEDLRLELVGRVEALVNANDHWRLQTSFRRRYATADATVRQALGQTRVYGQKEVGVSGWELEHDRELRGVDGKYEVMVDSHGRWLPGTWREVRPPQSGRDIYVPVILE